MCKDADAAAAKEGYINGYVARSLYGQYDSMHGSNVPTGLSWRSGMYGSKVPTGLSWRKGDNMSVPSMHELPNGSTYNRFKIDKRNETNPHLKWAADATVGVSDLEPIDGFSDRKRVVANIKGDVVTPLPHAVAERATPSIGGEILTQTDYSIGYVPSRMISVG